MGLGVLAEATAISVLLGDLVSGAGAEDVAGELAAAGVVGVEVDGEDTEAMTFEPDILIEAVGLPVAETGGKERWQVKGPPSMRKNPKKGNYSSAEAPSPSAAA